MSNVPLSVLDLASISAGDSIGQSLHNCVTTARAAERLGYTRVWYAEHHNFETIASSATAVLIAHVAANTTTIRLGSGGVMLPNHSPLVIAEQFGTLAELHPGRIDLGLGRAPGTDQTTVKALRRDPRAAETFAQDVQELQGFLSDTSLVPNVIATPGKGTHVPLYILGSSLFGAQIAALLGLPFAFASHFAPVHLLSAARIYRERFTPSEQLQQPHMMASINVIAADTDESAQSQLQTRRRSFTRGLYSRQGHTLTDDQVEQLLNDPRGAHVDQMLTYSAVGTPEVVKTYVENFQSAINADEIITVHHCDSSDNRVRSLELLAEVSGLLIRQ